MVTAANFNSPDQIVIAGNAGAVKRASDLAKAAGAKRAVPLPVSAPFHCPLMKPAQDAMRPELDKTNFSDLRVPLINNWQAAEIRTGADAREGLIRQIPGAVRWAQSMELLGSYGVDACIEVGAGSVLTGLLRTIQPNLSATASVKPTTLVHYVKLTSLAFLAAVAIAQAAEPGWTDLTTLKGWRGFRSPPPPL